MSRADEIGRALKAFLAQPRTRESLTLVLALAPALWLAVQAALQIPLGRDHATHLFKAWHFWTEMLGRWRLRGWSHFWGFGTPFDELVPPGGEIWVALFRALTLGQLEWERTYALAFGGLLVFKTFAAYWFTRRYFGVGAAVACAWITLFDPGAPLEGGWDWHTEWGVWPVTLAMSFVLLSLERLERVLRAGRARDVALTGLWLSAALLTHQLTLVVLALAVPLLAADQRWRREPATLRHSLDALAALAFGAVLASFFLVPFLARTGETQDLGTPGATWQLISQRFLNLETFQNVWRPVHALAIVGACLALRMRRSGALFFAGCASVMVVLASDVLVYRLHLERALPTLIKIESTRMLLAAKLFWFPLAGHALLVLTRAPFGEPATRTNRWRRALGVAALLMVGGALIIPGARTLYEAQIQKTFSGPETLHYWGDLHAFADWSLAQRRATTEHYRIAYNLPPHDHSSTAMPLYNETLMYKVGSTPTQIFNRFPTTDEDPLWRDLSVKYVLSSRRLQRDSLAYERRFGSLWLYRLKSYRPEPFTMIGPGQAELLTFEPERIRLKLSGTTAESRLKLHVASYPRWRASIAGTTLPITTVPVDGPDYPVLMEVPARDGELVFEYVYRAPDWFGLLLSLAAVPGLVGWLRFVNGTTRLERAAEWLAQRRRPIAIASALVLATSIALLMYRGSTRAALLPARSLFHALQGPELTLAELPCAERAPLRFVCGAEHVQAAAIPSEVWGQHLCMNAPEVGELLIEARQTLGSFIDVQYDATRAGGQGHIRVAVDSRELGHVETRPASERHQFLRFDTRELRGREALLQISLDGAALRCFDVDVVP